MKLDTGNRSFLLLLLVGIGLYLALSAAACALLSLLLYRLATDGSGAFADESWAAAPAVAFLALLGAGGVLGVRSLGAQIASSRRLSRRIERLTGRPTTELVAAGEAAGLRDRVTLIEGDEPFSFTYGALRPQVVVSEGLLDSTSPPELEAVLVHERYHVRNFDPLKVVLSRALARGFFFLPLLRALEGRYLAGRELAADRRALESCGRRPLASALLKVMRGPTWPELSTAAAVGGPELLDVRVAQLESGIEPRLAGVSSRTAALTATGAVAVLASLAAAVAGLGGLTAALDMSGEDMMSPGLAPLMAAGCATPWAVGGWLAWRWFRA
jgi:Zn-dependent protease with chaperone function